MRMRRWVGGVTVGGARRTITGDSTSGGGVAYPSHQSAPAQTSNPHLAPPRSFFSLSFSLFFPRSHSTAFAQLGLGAKGVGLGRQGPFLRDQPRPSPVEFDGRVALTGDASRWRWTIVFFPSGPAALPYGNPKAAQHFLYRCHPSPTSRFARLESCLQVDGSSRATPSSASAHWVSVPSFDLIFFLTGPTFPVLVHILTYDRANCGSADRKDRCRAHTSQGENDGNKIKTV
ncbi:hypothetical protein F5148DRAFT_1204682 [Russula earlei]|uniref:Uncharacterized protein n=1 Tax=Russula earlei TaxID=71964 RepID=A0ACC0U790_9AGAM|nr:hypothetical protein F5148DRAFT_1204682 [Russula earlei]